MTGSDSVIGKLTAVNSVADGLLWTHLDHLGTPRVKTDSTGKVALRLGQPDRDWYYPFGEQINAPADGVRERFTGQERDPESGLDYFGYRHYGSSLGRFMSPDPLLSSGRLENPQTWNRYAYAANNPLRYVDPLGLFPSPTLIATVRGRVASATSSGKYSTSQAS